MKYLLLFTLSLLFLSCNKNSDITDLDNEPIRFLSSPHGITRWNEEYSYLIRCESDENLETTISVSEDDTCKGTIDSNTYTFTPTEKAFPGGKCIIAVECTDGTRGIIQKTEILIPNPDSLSEIAHENYIEFFTSWNDENSSIVWMHGSKLYGIQNSDTAVDLLEGLNIIPGISTPHKDGLFFKAQERITTEYALFFTNGKKNGTIEVLNKNDFPSKYQENFSINSLSSPLGLSGILLELKYLDNKELWYYMPETEYLKQIENENINIYSFRTCDDQRCIISCIDHKFYKFDEETLSIEPLCPDIDLSFEDILFKDHIFQKHRLSCQPEADKCLSYFNVETCEEFPLDKNKDEMGGLRLFRNQAIYAFISYSDHILVTQITEDGKKSEVTINGKILDYFTLKKGLYFKVTNGTEEEDYVASPAIWPPLKIENCAYEKKSDNTHLLCVNDFQDNFNIKESCYRTYNLETGIEIYSQLKCNSTDSFKILGTTANNIYMVKSELKYNPQNLKADYSGSFSQSDLIFNFEPESKFISECYSYNGESCFYFTSLFAGYPFTIYVSDNSTPFKKKLAINSKYIPVAVKNDELILKSRDNLIKYNISTAKAQLIKSGLRCQIGDNDYSYSAGDFYFNGDLILFSTLDKENCNTRIVWTTNGTEEGTTKHDIKYESVIWDYSVHPSEDGGFYVKNNNDLYYIDNTGKNASMLAFGEIQYIGKTKNGTAITLIDPYNGNKKVICYENGIIKSEHALSQDISADFIFADNKDLIIFANLYNNLEILHFNDGDLSQKPVSQTIFNESVKNIKVVAKKDKTTAYLLEREEKSTLIIFLKIQNDSIDNLLEPINIYDYADNYDYYDPVYGVFADSVFLYETETAIYSIYSSDDFGIIKKTLFNGEEHADEDSDYKGRLSALGSDYEGIAVFCYENSSDNSKLILSKGTPDSTFFTDTGYISNEAIVNGKIVIDKTVYEYTTNGNIEKTPFSTNINYSEYLLQDPHIIFLEKINNQTVFKEYFIPTPVQSH